MIDTFERIYVSRPSIRTPWGGADYSEEYAPGLVFYSTPSHGGFCVSPDLAAKMPVVFKSHNTYSGNDAQGYWFEEDCEWSLVVICFPEHFTTKEVEQAHRKARNWYPDAYEAHYGVVIPLEESHVKRDRIFDQQNTQNFVTVAAWGDWHELVPENFVGVATTLGGRGNNPNGETKYFLVPKEEYEHRKGSFVIDINRHATWSGPT